ncbi:MAG: DUF421 domain-containing protein [Anaerolineae bacterium]|nr:DUF421 domain-containing protein [Anaerolineae bacterium]
MFFDSWYDLVNTVITGIGAYIILIVFLRISGKRTLSKMNAFDLVVTVALGSTLASIMLSKEVALAEGTVAFVTLILLQFVITWTSVRSKLVRRFVKAEPTLLFHQGEYLTDALHHQRVIQDEVLAAVRSQGFTSLNDVGAVVMETDGNFTVLPRLEGEQRSTLQNVKNYPQSENMSVST